MSLLKKISIAFLIGIVFLLSGCSEKITLENIEKLETQYDYSTVLMNKYVKESKETKIITDAKEFSKKFISVQLTRGYDDKTGVEKEKLMYTEEYIEAQGEKLEEALMDVVEFYNKYELKTEVQSVDYNRIINLNGDAFVNAVAKVRLIECNDTKIADILGYKDGMNSNVLCEYNIKMKYLNGDYYVYDYNIVEKEGQLSAIATYKNIEDHINEFGVKNEAKIKQFVRVLAYAQNNRDYKVFNGDEDYIYLSESYKAELNKDKDDVKVTKDAYVKFKINTEFVSAKVKNIKEEQGGYVVTAGVKVKLLECLNNEVAKNIGFYDGIGSEAELVYEYIVGYENDELKLLNMKNL